MNQPTDLPGYRSPRDRGTAATVTLWIALAFHAVLFLTNAYFVFVSARYSRDNFALTLFLGLTASLTLINMLVTAILFLRWFHMAYGNLPALGQQIVTMSPGRAVWGFFIPVLSLWEPYQCMTEIWAVSNSPLAEEGGPPQGTPRRLAWWWIPFVASGVLSLWASWLKAPADQDLARVLLMIHHGLRVLSGLYLIGLIKEIGLRQDHKARLLTQRSTDDRPYRGAAQE
jgi:hypothetical protein